MKKLRKPSQLHLSRETLLHLDMLSRATGGGTTGHSTVFGSTSALPPCDTCTCSVTINCGSWFGTCDPCANRPG